ncbi:MAG TPA: PASTA domain-containing protein [Acidimicrobiales bacterium]|nr:PASTA domain-containing protein [Acidimicrobiales bacterium]
MATMTDQLGRVLAGRYRLDAGIGTGSSGHVYLAFDARLSRRVAVKVLHPWLAADGAFLRRFRAEAQAAAALSHPSVLGVYDWGEEPDGPFLVLEYLGGGSLRDLLDAGARLSPAQAAAIGRQAAAGLAYAHRRGLVHRDVKPANLLFDEEGRVRIADFGLARALSEAASTEPFGAVLGTARYASPEQAEGRPLDGRSDVYSLALTLYEAVTGRVPFSGDTTVATLMARVGAALPPAAELGPLAPILAQAAIADPLGRLDAEELAAHLEILRASLPPPAPLPLAPRRPRAPTRPEPIASAAGSPAGAPVLFDGQAEVEEVFEAAPARRRRLPLAVALVLVLLAAGAGAGAYYRFVLYGERVPPLLGASLASARRLALAAGLHLDVSGRRYSARVPAGDVLVQSPAAGRHVRRGATVAIVVSLGHAPVEVPALAGEPASRATARLEGAHLRASIVHRYSETIPAGTVVATRPAGGRAPYGSSVVLVVSLGPHPRTVPVGLAGSSWQVVSATLRRERLEPIERLAYSSSVARGDVVATTPAPGTAGVPVGSEVVVVVSRGPRLVRVPDVAGDTIAAAVAALRAAGLDVTEQVGPPFATKATTTDPAPGALVAPGSSVTLYAA